MEFGEWLLNIRKKQELDVRSIAEKTGVDSSTISRTENQQTQTTLYTAFRISEGMGVSLSDLLRILEGHGFPSLDEAFFVEDNSVLALQEIERIINKFHSDQKRVANILADDLNAILDEINLDHARRSELFVNYETIPYAPSDIEKMLFKSPLSFRIDPKYPSEIRPDTIMYTFQRKGAFILHDVETYITKEFPKSRIRLPMFSSSRIGAGSLLERIKFSEVLQFDLQTEQGGKIIGMYWEACRFYATFTTLPQRLTYEQLALFDLPNERVLANKRAEWVTRLAVVCLLIYRWYQYLKGSDFVWKIE